jgi:phosphoserine phosphatase RsbU/P
MLYNFLARSSKLLGNLADSWLEAGASAVALLEDKQQVAAWGVSSPQEIPVLQSPIQVGRRSIGELHIYGLSGETWQERLAVDTRFIAELVRLESELEGMTSDLIDNQDQVLALYNLSQSMRRQLDLDQALSSLAKEAAGLVKVEGAFIISSAEQTVIEQYPAKLLSHSVIQTLFDEYKLSDGGKLLLTPADVPHLLPISIECLLLKAIFTNDRIVGLLGLVNRAGGFTSPDIKLARAIADQAGAYIENLLLHQERLAQTRLQTEMDLARQVQLRLLMHEIPRVQGTDLYGASKPALQVGGDFFDFLLMENGELLFTVGDVSGKGMSAALLMSMTRTALRSAARTQEAASPIALLDIVNTDLYDDFTEVTMFATIFVGLYNPLRQEIVYANGGHSPVIYCPAEGRAQLLRADGPGLGILPNMLSENQTLPLRPGDVLVVATDGFPEDRSSDGEMFGYERLLQLVETNAHCNSQNLAQALSDALAAFTGSTPQDDDQTLIVIKGVP